MCARTSFAFAIAGCVLTIAPAAWAQQFMPTGKDTLRSLPGVEVLVEPIAPELAGGLTTAGIAGDVTRLLTSSGVTVYPSQTQNPSTAKAYVYVQVGGVVLPRQGSLLAIQVQLRQTLRSLVTGSAIVNAMTWDQSGVLLALPGSNAQQITGEIRGLVDEFIRDWRAVH